MKLLEHFQTINNKYPSSFFHYITTLKYQKHFSDNQNVMYFNNNRTTTPFGIQWGAPRYNKAPSKVVSIPVHFIGSERNRTASATKIQRVARGYLVRKSVKKMMKMKVELEEIDKKVNNEETVMMMMKKEQKERIRIGETIMNLLLKLDSVRVFHFSALRNLRKLLIKRAIFLQEFVDQIQMVGPTDNVEENCMKTEKVECEEEIEGCKKLEALVNEDGEVNCMENEEEREAGNEDGGKGTCVKEDDNCMTKVKEEEGGDEDEKKMEEEEKEESVGSSFLEQEIEEDMDVKEEEEGRNVIFCEDKEDENREILRRMLNENEKMMYMMTQLFEKNEKQTSLLTSLTQRVEQLERAFTCDKLKKKNNRRRNIDAKHRYNGFI